MRETWKDRITSASRSPRMVKPRLVVDLKSYPEVKQWVDTEAERLGVTKTRLVVEILRDARDRVLNIRERP